MCNYSYIEVIILFYYYNCFLNRFEEPKSNLVPSDLDCIIMAIANHALVQIMKFPPSLYQSPLTLIIGCNTIRT